MRETIKKVFFAILPFVRKAATDAMDSSAKQKDNMSPEAHHQEQNHRSSAPSPKDAARASQKRQHAASSGPAPDRADNNKDDDRGAGYPGDYRGGIDFEYSPSLDGDADPGEIVWTWVPYEEDYSQGKDRPVVLVGRDGEYLLALMMTSKDHNNREHTDRDYLDIGSGPWDAAGRDSEVKLDRVIRVHPQDMRREGAIMPRETFSLIQKAYNRNHG